MGTTLPWAQPRDWLLVCDSVHVLGIARRQGWRCARLIDDLACDDRRPALCLLLATRVETVQNARLREWLATTRTIYLGLHAFDASPQATEYSLQQIATSDFRGAIARNRRWVHRLERRRELRFRTGPPAAAGSCIPADDLDVGTVVSRHLAPGSIVSLGAFFEVELEGLADSAPPFVVNGELVVDGVLVALDDDFAGDRAAARSRAQPIADGARHGRLCLSISDNLVIGCFSDAGRSLLADVAAAVDGDLRLTEFAIGTNRLPAPNFAVNAQINEGAGGVHVGLGGGARGLHLDFVALTAKPVAKATR